MRIHFHEHFSLLSTIVYLNLNFSYSLLLDKLSFISQTSQYNLVSA